MWNEFLLLRLFVLCSVRIVKNIYLFQVIITGEKKKYDDLWILKKLINYLNQKNENCILIIRPHPSESYKKFNTFSSSKKIKIIFDKNSDLLSSLNRVTIVFGHNSMAMVLAKICGLKTININIVGQKNFLPDKYIDKYI